MNKTGYLVISLDFELLWGVFDVIEPFQKKIYFENTKDVVIPEILKRFQDYNIHATWAIVGMLFNTDWNEWEKNIPAILPEYENERLSAYSFAKQRNSAVVDEMVFAPKEIIQIGAIQGQEIGTHTYSHYYCLEPGQNEEQFKADLEKALQMAGKLGINITSLVFPRNQLKKNYLEICSALGIENVRSNPSSWYWKDTQSEHMYNKLARTGDAYFPLGKKSYPLNEIEHKMGLPMEQKASRFLRPVEGNNLLRRMKLSRIKAEITQAAERNEVYHLWWHPHNFGDNPKQSLLDLDEILNHFKVCQNKYGMESVNMQELNHLVQRIN